MDDRVKISSSAQKELEDSSKWYEEQLPGLGEKFAGFIYNSIDSISKNPETYPKKKLNNREFVVDKYPFVIVYQYKQKADLVIILHIFHTSRNPKLKYNRK